MKIGIVSDTHGNMDAVEAVAEAAPDVELWLHAGDFVEDARYLEKLSDTGVVKVAGNGDWPRTEAPMETVVEIAGHRIFLTHGHTYGVNYGREGLMEAARAEGCDIAVYGHTHKADYVRAGEDGISILNPGSASRPRDERRPSFMTAELFPGEEAKVELFRMEEE